MRDLKFRAWSLNNKRWYKGNWQFQMSDQDLNTDRDLFIVQQYTGFKDKENKEIYEGDIIGIRSRMCEIVWREGAFCTIYPNEKFDYERDYGMPGNLGVKGSPWKIYGNICENPTLIERKDEHGILIV